MDDRLHMIAAACRGQSFGLVVLALRPTASIFTAVAAIAMFAPIHLAIAAEVGAGKGDYRAPVPRRSESVVPKSIYLTPKSDRLKRGKANRADPESRDPASRKASRQHISPADEEPWIAETEDILNDEQSQPENALPSDPHVSDAPKTAVKPARKKSKPRRRGRPIDVALHNGRLKLNRFQTLTMDMPHKECRQFPDIFVSDYKLPRAAVDVLADNLLIVQKRICADNGAVMVTCYQNSATISMRRAKPDDGCKR